MFTKNSGLVKLWAGQLDKDETKTINDVPNLSNLREMVELSRSVE